MRGKWLFNVSRETKRKVLASFVSRGTRGGGGDKLVPRETKKSFTARLTRASVSRETLLCSIREGNVDGDGDALGPFVNLHSGHSSGLLEDAQCAF